MPGGGTPESPDEPRAASGRVLPSALAPSSPLTLRLSPCPVVLPKLCQSCLARVPSPRSRAASTRDVQGSRCCEREPVSLGSHCCPSTPSPNPHRQAERPQCPAVLPAEPGSLPGSHARDAQQVRLLVSAEPPALAPSLGVREHSALPVHGARASALVQGSFPASDLPLPQGVPCQWTLPFPGPSSQHSGRQDFSAQPAHGELLYRVFSTSRGSGLVRALQCSRQGHVS